MHTLIQKYLRIIKYIITGGSAFAAEYLVFLLLFYVFDLPVVVAHPISFMVGFVVSFSLSRQWVFGNAHAHRPLAQILMYFGLVLINIAITTWVIALLVQVGVWAFVAKIIVTAMIACWNYFIYKYLIFRQSN